MNEKYERTAKIGMGLQVIGTLGFLILKQKIFAVTAIAGGALMIGSAVCDILEWMNEEK